MIPDIESAAKVSKDLFLDEKIPSEGCGTLGTLERKGSLQSFHIPRANNMHVCCLLVLDSVSFTPQWIR